MKRPKTVQELRREIIASPLLRARPQEEISRTLKINQGTFSRIQRGQFKRRSTAVDRVCEYARISRITERPLSKIETSLAALSQLAGTRSPGERRALKLIRLAAELLENEQNAILAPQGSRRSRTRR